MSFAIGTAGRWETCSSSCSIRLWPAPWLATSATFSSSPGRCANSIRTALFISCSSCGASVPVTSCSFLHRLRLRNDSLPSRIQPVEIALEGNDHILQPSQINPNRPISCTPTFPAFIHSLHNVQVCWIRMHNTSKFLSKRGIYLNKWEYLFQ